MQAARVRRWCLGFFIFNCAVILFGAVVRITGSGAGCGQHWPTCHGEVLHLPKSVETIIELTHRATSGLDLLLCIFVLALTFRVFEKGHWARKGAALSLLWMITEALVGARLVISELVGMNDTMPRALVMMIHLLNTSLLTSAILVALFSARTQSPRFGRWRSKLSLRLWAAIACVLLISATGAVTALGDTVYPVAEEGVNLSKRWLEVRSSQAHFLKRVRMIHPALAIAGSALASWLLVQVLDRLPKNAFSRPWIKRSLGVIALQILLGVVNIVLSAPGWMQVLHLAAALALWSTLTLSLLGCAQDKAPST